VRKGSPPDAGFSRRSVTSNPQVRLASYSGEEASQFLGGFLWLLLGEKVPAIHWATTGIRAPHSPKGRPRPCTSFRAHPSRSKARAEGSLSALQLLDRLRHAGGRLSLRLDTLRRSRECDPDRRWRLHSIASWCLYETTKHGFVRPRHASQSPRNWFFRRRDESKVRAAGHLSRPREIALPPTTISLSRKRFAAAAQRSGLELRVSRMISRHGPVSPRSVCRAARGKQNGSLRSPRPRGKASVPQAGAGAPGRRPDLRSDAHNRAVLSPTAHPSPNAQLCLILEVPRVPRSKRREPDVDGRTPDFPAQSPDAKVSSEAGLPRSW
jgi:hypothetical protein